MNKTHESNSNARASVEPIESRVGQASIYGESDTSTKKESPSSSKDSTIRDQRKSVTELLETPSGIDSTADQPVTNLQTILAEHAVPQSVKLNDVDFENHKFEFRTSKSTPLDAEMIPSDDEEFDGTDGHDPIVVRATEGSTKYVIVAGRRRLSALKNTQKCVVVRAFVMKERSNDLAIAVAARANLRHGAALSRDERFECFKQDYQRQGSLEKPPKKTDWAKIYDVTRQTIHNWVYRLEGKSPEVSQDKRSAKSVKVLHDLDDDEAVPGPVDVVATDKPAPGDTPADSSAKSGDAVKGASQHLDMLSVRDQKANAREAVDAFRTAIGLLLDCPEDQLRPYVAQLWTDLSSLPKFIREFNNGKGEAA